MGILARPIPVFFAGFLLCYIEGDDDPRSILLAVKIRTAIEADCKTAEVAVVDAKNIGSQKPLTFEEMLAEVELVFDENDREDTTALSYYEEICATLGWMWLNFASEARDRPINAVLHDLDQAVNGDNLGDEAAIN